MAARSGLPQMASSHCAGIAAFRQEPTIANHCSDTEVAPPEKVPTIVAMRKPFYETKPFG